MNKEEYYSRHILKNYDADTEGNYIKDQYLISCVAFDIVRELNKNFGIQDCVKILEIAKVLVK